MLALLLWKRGLWALRLSSCYLQALERRPDSPGSWVQLLHGMWDPLGPGSELGSPALAVRFLPTAPPGKPLLFFSH